MASRRRATAAWRRYRRFAAKRSSFSPGYPIRSPVRLTVLMAVVVAATVLAAPEAAQACSRDDSVFYETFIDTSCLQLPLTNTTLDALGGLRLTTNGAPSATLWDGNTDFDNGVTYQNVVFPPVGVRTLVRNGTGTGATLGLPTTLLPLGPDPANPVLRPTAATVLDNDNVDDAALAKVGSTYRMWYSGRSGVFGAIGYATSADGIAWVKSPGFGPPLAVLAHGPAGSADSFSAADPTVMKDGSTWKMWYTGDDSSKKRVAYATSVDGS